MTDYIILISLMTSFLVTLLLLPSWMKKARQIGLVWDDMNKIKSEKVAGSGGLITVLGFIIGVLIFIAYRVFYLESSEFLVEILAILVVVLLLSCIGLVDDLLGWQHGGLSRRSRIILVAFSAIPLMVINAGKSTMLIPFIGIVDFRYFYPLLIIPFGVVGATTTFNFLAGYNGLEAGQGILLLSTLAAISFFIDKPWLGVIALCMVLSLLAFLRFNFYPAKVFPGDSLTYAIGGLIAVMAIIGNFEKIAVFIFFPYILEVILKLRGGLVKQSFGRPQSDGTLNLNYDKIYGLEHLSIYLMLRFGIKPTEKKVVFSLWAFQLLFIIAAFIMFERGIFYGIR